MSRVHALAISLAVIRQRQPIYQAVRIIQGHASTAMMGSRITGPALLKPWRNAYWAASWNAISLLSTECATPSVSAILMPCQAQLTVFRGADKRSLLGAKPEGPNMSCK